MGARVYSETEVCNMALTRLKVLQISNLTEDSDPARWCNANYAILRDTFLQDHQWNFAIRRATLASSTENPNHEFAKSYPLPGDFLAIVRTYDEAMDRSVEYRIEDRAIVTDADSVSIEYVARVEDLNRWDAMAIDAFAQRIAAEAAFALTGSRSVADLAMTSYMQKLAAAKTIDSQSGTPRVVMPNDWLNARRA